MSTRPYPDVEAELRELDWGPRDFELGVLGDCRFGTLGHECIAFLTRNNLPALSELPGSEALDAGRVLCMRRALLNDALHVLLGFNADAPGEVGVASFVAAQGYCPEFESTARTLAQLCMTLAPWLRDELQDAEYRGRQLATQAPRLLTMPLEREWDTPLTCVQSRLKLRAQGSLPSVRWGDWETARRRAEQWKLPRRNAHSPVAESPGDIGP